MSTPLKNKTLILSLLLIAPPTLLSDGTVGVLVGAPTPCPDSAVGVKDVGVVMAGVFGPGQGVFWIKQ